MSDDAQVGLTLIAFVGSVFSPRYARARASGLGANPAAFPAFNVALYQNHRTRWAMTEWPSAATERDADNLRLGSNHMRWNGDRLEVSFDERSAPFGRRLQGRVVLEPWAMPALAVGLDAQEQHRWFPVAPLARAEVWLTSPPLHFEGTAYHDANLGRVPLERSFQSWTWSRTHDDGHAVVLYDTIAHDGDETLRGFRFDRHGQVTPHTAPVRVDLGRGRWGVRRTTRVATGDRTELSQVLEDTPFYARSLLRAQAHDTPTWTMHESLSLDRFQRPWVQFLLPFRIRRGRWPR